MVCSTGGAVFNSITDLTELKKFRYGEPGPDAGDSEIRQYAQNLSAFIKQFSGTPQQAEARAELQRITSATKRPP